MENLFDNEIALWDDFHEFDEAEADYGASATQQKVRWYQTILRIVVADPTVSLNGNHNDPATRKALRKLQEYYELEPTSYLTVESNAALTQMALEWIYRVRISNKIGRWSSTLTNQIKQFQRDYGLKSDGKIGPLTRAKMMDVLLAKLPTPIKNFHSQLGPTGLVQRQTEVLDAGSLETAGFLDTDDETFDELESELDPSGIHGRDDRRPVTLPANIPWRWICRIKIDGLWAGSGVLISPRHVLTAGHVVYGDKNDSKGFRRYSMAKSLAVSPAFDGHVLRRNRQFNKRAPFGTWPVDMNRIFMPSCYRNELQIIPNHDCDLAVVTLKTDIGTRKFTTKKTVFQHGRRKHIFRDFDPLGYWGIDNHHKIVAYKPGDRDVCRIFTGGYPGTSKGIMQHVAGQVDNSRIQSRFIHPDFRYTVNLYENRFAHLLDTSPGQSGSPIWRQVSSSNKVRRIIGIVTLVRETFNEGVALTPNFLREIADWAPQTFQFDSGRLRVRQ
jgi:V8-like Glu-specific endopeptidase